MRKIQVKELEPWVVAQLAEWSPLATEILGLNPTIDKLICLLHRIDEIKKKKPPHFSLDQA